MADVSQRPVLTTYIEIDKFKAFYWLKEELLKFCQEQNLSTSGSKAELAQRIELFLQNGSKSSLEKNNSKNAPGKNNRSAKVKTSDLRLEAILTENYKSDEIRRAFFKSIIGAHFRFTTGFMQFCKANPQKTYREAVEFWQTEQAAKKNKTQQTVIAPQFEYNQFIRDFLTANKGSSLKQAISAWKVAREQPGSRRYSEVTTKR